MGEDGGGTAGKKRLERDGALIFAHRLALKLGIWDVRGLLSRMPMRQFEDWRAYADLEPFDEERMDLRIATVVKAVYDVHRKKGSPQVKLSDCVLKLRKGRSGLPRNAEQARKEVKATMKMMVEMFRGAGKV